MESLTKALASQYPGEKSDRSEAEMSHVLTQLCGWLVRAEIRFWLIKRSIYITKQTKFGRRDLARRVLASKMDSDEETPTMDIDFPTTNSKGKGKENEFQSNESLPWYV